MQVVLEQNDLFYARTYGGSTERITSAPFYKMNIRRYVGFVDNSTIFFKPHISYLSLKRIIEVFQKSAPSQGFELIISPKVLFYIEQRELHLLSRSKLGIEIKKQDEKLHSQFCKFCECVNQLLERSLRDKQLWDAFFLTSMKKSCNFSVPGSGKTSSVYGMFAFLKAQGLVKRIVVICPKSAFGPWIDEFKVCFGDKDILTLFNIQDPAFNSIARKISAVKYESGSANLLLFNYECIKGLEHDLSGLIDDQTLLVFDEVHRIKKIEGEYAGVAIRLARGASYVVAMTGTPIPNSYTDIYNLLHILYAEEYNDFFSFSLGCLRNPQPSECDIINAKLQPFFCRTTKEQLLVPPANSDGLLPLRATMEETKIFECLLKKHKRNKLLLMLRILQLESDPTLLLAAIDLADYAYILDEDCPVDEIDYADYSNDILNCISSIGISSKAQQCISLVNGLMLQGKKVIIWCIFVKSIQYIANVLKKQGVHVEMVYGEVPLENRHKIIEGFKQNQFDVLITNPNTLAESVSLHTICHDAIYFEYSFNLVHFLQSKDRIHRLGLKDEQYTQFYFLEVGYSTSGGYYSMDEQIYQRLKDKETTMLKAINAELLEQMPSTDEELEMIFSPLNM